MSKCVTQAGVDMLRYVGLIVQGGYIYPKQDTLNGGSARLDYFRLRGTSNVSHGYTDVLRKSPEAVLALSISRWQPSSARSYRRKRLS